MNCNCEEKLQMQTVAYNLNRNLWANNDFATEELHNGVYGRAIVWMSGPPFQLLFLCNACKAYSRNIYIPDIVELTNDDPTLTLHRQFLGFNFMYMNINDYHIMQSLNITLE